MIRPRFSLGGLAPRLLAVLIVCLSPAAALASSLTFTNEQRGAVVVHTASVINGRLFRNKPYLLKYGESTPAIPRVGNMTVIICDARMVNRKLWEGAVSAGATQLFFGIVPGKGPAPIAVLRRPPPPPPPAMAPGR